MIDDKTTPVEYDTAKERILAVLGRQPISAYYLGQAVWPDLTVAFTSGLAEPCERILRRMEEEGLCAFEYPKGWVKS